jgi:phosphate:Na+ symporter
MTGWLVSLVGFGFKIDSFALPILAFGMAVRLLGRGPRAQGLGQSLAGFGLFFLGLAVLKDTFAELAAGYGAALPEGGVATFLAVGFVATLLTQSSSATVAIILTAASGGMVGTPAAAAAVIGASIGTTSTAAMAVLKATPAAKRLALGQIAFTAITGGVALLLLPVLLWGIGRMIDGFGLEPRPALVLAFFHTVFTAIGVALLLPFSDRLASVLERLFRRAEEDLGRPRHLDATVAATPALAVSALRQELFRLRSLVAAVAQSAASRDEAPSAVEARSEALRTLGSAVANFIARLRTEAMPTDVAEEMARSLRIGRYLNEAARSAPRCHALRAGTQRLPRSEMQAALDQVLAHAAACAALADRPDDAPETDAERATALEAFHAGYQRAKAGLLAFAVAGRLSVEETEALLDHLSATRRMVEQLVKADRLLRSPERAGAIERSEENRPLDSL